MYTIATIGSGSIGTVVARLSIRAGHTVVMSNRRGPDSLAELVEAFGPLAHAATPADAADAADLVVVAVPLSAYKDMPADSLRGKIVIDANNYYPDRDGHIDELDTERATSSELLQRHLPDSFVVKAFNNITAEHIAALARPNSPDRSALPIAGDSPRAKATVTEFLESIGWDAVDAGPLAEGWRFQPNTAAYVRAYAPTTVWHQLRSAADVGAPEPLPAAALRERLAAAVRYRDMRPDDIARPEFPGTA
jgi:8-hydroxy-5-deazaflavin:NADPH oxidoreductase